MSESAFNGNGSSKQNTPADDSQGQAVLDNVRQLVISRLNAYRVSLACANRSILDPEPDVAIPTALMVIRCQEAIRVLKSLLDELAGLEIPAAETSELGRLVEVVLYNLTSGGAVTPTQEDRDRAAAIANAVHKGG